MMSLAMRPRLDGWTNTAASLEAVGEECEGCVVVVSRLPPPWFELQIFRLPGKGGYSTRPPGTTDSLAIWVER